VNASTPVVVNNQVFISETYGVGSSLLEVAPGKHEVVWSDEDRGRGKSMLAHWNTPVYHDGYLYGSSGRHTENAELRCLDWKTGKVQWSVPELSRTSLLYVDGHFVMLGEYGDVILFRASPEKFQPVAQTSLVDPAAPKILGVEPRGLLKYPCWAAPILSHGLLYLRGDDRLVCLEIIPEKE
jgi:outer membrane protein assembly factor BamB